MTDFFFHTWSISQELAPWLLLGLAVAGLLHVLLPTGFVLRHLGGGRFSSVVKAALVGVPLPLCSCGVIPAALGLRKDGAGKGASVSFLISTPQTGIDSIAVTASMLGLPFALFKVVSAFLMGIVGGTLVNFAEPPAIAPASNTSQATPKPTYANPIAEALRFTYYRLFHEIWAWLLLGILISAAITTIAPPGSLADSPWATGLTGMLLMLAIGIPLYVCATGSVPIAASLVAAGMPTGAALVFLMAGPATNIATIGAVLKTFGKKATAIYLTVIIAGSFSLGLLFNTLFPSGGGHHLHHVHEGFLPEWLEFAAVLLMFIGMTHFALLTLIRKDKRRPQSSPSAKDGAVLIPLNNLQRPPSKSSCCGDSADA